MKYEDYDAVEIAADLSSFDFLSRGRNGNILKRIIFMPTELPDIYILAFGSVTADDEIDDHSVTDNGDTATILATVRSAVNRYTHRYPGRLIYFSGSTKARTRLYRMAISLNLEELSQTFDIFAEVDDPEGLIPFCKNMEINAFLIKRR